MQCHHHDLAHFDVLPGSRTPYTRHSSELKEINLTTVTVDGLQVSAVMIAMQAHHPSRKIPFPLVFQAGVGGIDSWGSVPLPQHRISLEEPIEWSFVLRPFSNTDSMPRLLAQQIRARR